MKSYRKLFVFPLFTLLLAIAVPVSVAMLHRHPVSVSAAGQMPYVHGNQIIDGFGHPLILRGAHIDSNLVAIKPYITATEILAGQNLTSATFDIMRNSWNMNAVRIGTSDYIWKASPTAYISTLQRVVAAANQAGLYVVLSLHEDLKSGLPASANEGGSNMPTSEATPYWQAVAKAFKDNPMVMFDVFNEPRLFGAAGKSLTYQNWQLWLNGGQLPNCQGCITVVGMQTLVNTIRQAGAKQIIIAEALQNWFQTFQTSCPSGSTCNFINDPEGNIVYSAHNYFTPNALTTSEWTVKYGDDSSTVNLLALVPMFVGEWALTPNVAGLGRCSFTPDQAIALVNSFLQFMQQYNMSWTAFSFTLKQLFLDYANYTPSQLAAPNGLPTWTCGQATPIVGDGALVKQYLLANPPASYYSSAHH
jgi:aryl-phospho-beta-D-glucosidase BglC (GH1 family)